MIKHKNSHVYKIVFSDKYIIVFRCLYEDNSIYSVRPYPKTDKNILRVMRVKDIAIVPA